MKIKGVARDGKLNRQRKIGKLAKFFEEQRVKVKTHRRADKRIVGYEDVEADSDIYACRS